MSFKLTDFITVSNTGVTTFGSDGILINRTGADAYLFFQKSGTNRGAIYGGDVADGNGLRFFIGNNSDPSLSIVSNGNVGIGTSSPNTPLHVSGNIITIEDSVPSLRLIGTAGSAKTFDLKSDGGVFKVRDVNNGDELYHIAAGGSGYHKWYINDSLKMTLDSNGQVGIGTSSPGGFFDVSYDAATYNAPRLTDTRAFAINNGAGLDFLGKVNTAGQTTRFGSIYGKKENATDGNTAGYLEFQTNDVARMNITSTGNVGIGTTSPSSKLRIVSSGGTEGLRLNAGTSSSNFAIIANNEADNATLFYVKGNGDTSIGGKLDVTTSLTGFASTITNNKDDSQGLLVRTSDNDGGEYILDLQSSSTATGTDYASKFQVAKGGQVGINVTPASTRTLLVKGRGTDSSTAPFQINDGNNADILVIKDDKSSTFSGDVEISNLIKFVDPTAGSAGTPQFKTLLSYQFSNVNALSTIKGGNEASSTNGTYLQFFVNSSTAVNTPLNLLTLQSSFNDGTNATFSSDVKINTTLSTLGVLTVKSYSGANNFYNNLQLMPSDATTGGMFLGSNVANDGIITCGSYYGNAGHHIATATSATTVLFSGGSTYIGGDTGLTVGSSFVPSRHLTISSGGDATFNGNVSLADTKYIQLNNTSTDWQLRADNAGRFVVQTSGGSEFFKISSNGETTITATSTSGLILGQTGQSYYHNIRNQGDGLYIGVDDGGQGGSGADLRIAIKGIERMSIKESGDVFLGPFKATPASTYNKFYYMKTAPYNWDCGNTYNPNYEIAAIGMGSTGPGQDDGTILFQTAINVCSNTAASVLTTKMEITPEGVVAINTTVSGTEKLQVQGGIKVWYDSNFTRSSALGYDGLYNTGQNGYLWTSTAHDWLIGTNNTERMRISSTGHVGIGGTSTSSKLYMYGSINGYLTYFYNDGNDANYGGLRLNGGANDGSGTTYYIRCDDGDATEVGGLRNNNGTFQLYDSSDRSLKENIEDTDIKGLDRINALKVRKFNWKKNGILNVAGFVAQEVENIIPEASSPMDSGLLSVSVTSMVPTLVKAIQEQQTIIESQKSLIDSLTTRIEALED